MPKRLTTTEFIANARKVHGRKYDYSQVKYIDSRTKVKIICKKHGVFLKAPTHHIEGQGCKKCSHENLASERTMSAEHFIRKSQEAHGNFYDYSKVAYRGNDRKVVVICPNHGEFSIAPNNHYAGYGCPHCAGENHSYPERLFALVLDSLKAPYRQQVRFDKCRRKLPLPFDFQVFNRNKSKFILIEIDGEHHEKPLRFGNSLDKFRKTVTNDSIKNQFCIDNGIPLLRFRADDIVKVNTLVLLRSTKEHLKQYKIID